MVGWRKYLCHLDNLFHRLGAGDEWWLCRLHDEQLLVAFNRDLLASAWVRVEVTGPPT